MNFSSNDNPVLVAPRPVRLTSAPHSAFTRSHPVRLVSVPMPSDHFERVKITDESDLDDLKVGLFSDSSPPATDKDLASPRASPRSSLPSEALEEFLSILRPSFFPPTSPILRARRHGAASIGSFPYERPYPYKSRTSRLEIVQQKNDPNNIFSSEDIDRARSTQPSRSAHSSSPESTGDSTGTVELDIFDNDAPMRWYTSATLSSPVSRMHTRNPFQRHPSYEIAFGGLLPSSPSNMSPSPLSPLSPAAVPLPLPTPDEMIEMS